MIEIDIHTTLDVQPFPLRIACRANWEDGTRAALFGSSGAGKTTVLRMLAGLSRPQRGRIVIGQNCWFDSGAGIDLPTQRRSLGFVFQDQALFPHLSVRDNVAYAASRKQADWVDELLELAGLSRLATRKPAALSGGQRQRVALARALTRKPALLLLDEPLSGLDAQSRSDLQDDLLRLQQRLGFSLLLVSHDIAEVFKLAEQVLVLEHGCVVRAGTPSTVFLRDRIAGRMQLQAQVLAVRREEVVHVVSLLVGHEIIDVLANANEADMLRPGDFIPVSMKAVNPLPNSRTR